MSGLAHAVQVAPIADDFPPIRAIAEVRGRLALPRQGIETHFLNLGRTLGECVQIVGAVTRLFDDLAQAGTVSTGSAGADQLETLARQALALAGSTAETTDDSHGLSRLMHMVSLVREPVLALEKTVQLIGLVAVSTRINAAHLTGTNEDFAVFTIDIGRLSDHVARTVKEFASVYGVLVSTLAAASDKQTRFEKMHQETMRSLIGELDASLTSVAQSRQRFVEASADMGKSFRRIASGIGAAVSALQIGDITRQRVEHIEEALAMLLDRHAAGQDEPTEFAAIIAAVCRLQTAQAIETRDQFDGEIRRLVETLRSLATEAGTIVEQSGRIHGAGVEARRMTTAELVGEVQKACTLIRSSIATREECDRAAGSVVNSLQDLMGCVAAVQEIEADMQIVSLNMGLKCARLGSQGHTLSIIAQELRSLTAQTVVYARNAIENLRAAATMAQSLATRSAAGTAKAVEALEAATSSATMAQQQIDRDLDDTLDTLKRDGARAAGLLAEVAARVMAEDQLRPALTTASKAIEAIRDSAIAAFADLGAGDMAAAETAAIAQLQSRYTMVSERLTHERLIEGGSVAVASVVDADDLDALFL